MTLKEMIGSGKKIEVTLDKKLTLSNQIEGYNKMNFQGGGTDGKYGYGIMNECGRTDACRSRIYKYDLETFEVVGYGDNLPMCHANDLVYDPYHHRLLISNCNVDSKVMSVVDPETLQLVDRLHITVGNYAMAYNAKKHRYVAGKSATYNISVMDDEFNELEVIPGEDGFTKQGMECDDDFIYMFHTGCSYNWIWVYTWEGKYITRIAVPMVGESEHLFIANGRWYGGFNNKEYTEGNVYEMHFHLTDVIDKYRLDR